MGFNSAIPVDAALKQRTIKRGDWAAAFGHILYPERMLPSVQDWLSASWADYRRRWTALMAVLALTGLATAFAVLLPALPALALTLAGAGSPWVIWGAAFLVSLLAGLYVSTWGQAALMRASAIDEPAGGSLRLGWSQTPAFALALSLALLAAGGGLVLLILPGLLVGALVFFAPYYQLSGEAEGLGSVELSWARVRPDLGGVLGRLALAGLIAFLPSWIPYLGWLLGPLWAPFGLVACGRLAADLKAARPAPARPSLGAPVAALGAVLLLATVGSTWAASRAVFAAADAYAQGRLALPDTATAQALLAVLQGGGTDEERRLSETYALSLSSAVARGAP